jgi:molybdopterin-guanine dinucleotide biosynthesis protein MobB
VSGAGWSGLDALLGDAERLETLRGKKIGLLANGASVTSGFVPAAFALRDAGLDVRVVFGPEHGFWGAAQDMEAVGGERGSCLPIVSLYGASFEDLSPRPHQLEGTDVVLSDLPDVGSRYYTFIWSTALMMKACGPLGIPVWVLDRPNPLGGERVEGNLPEDPLLSFVGLYPVVVRHGMTPAEIARLANSEFRFGCDLTVVPLRKGNRLPARGEIGAHSGPWVLPSPNMPTPDTALVYPGGCLVEGTNLSEGRGTTRPFEIVGAPWLDSSAAAKAANALGLPGVVFRPHVFRPTFQKHAGKTCGGVHLHVTDPESFRPYETGLRLIKCLRDLHPKEFRWRTEIYEYRDDVPAIDLLTGTARYRELVDEGSPLDSWISTFAEDEARFEVTRRPYLLYPAKRKAPVVLAVVGAHESGKTTVAVKLIEAFERAGLRVGSLKHTDHEYDTDIEGKDSQRHKAAGAEPAILVAGRRSAVHRRASQRQPRFADVESEFAGCDVVIVEGYRSEPLPKIEVCRAATGREPLSTNDPSVIAVVTDRATPHPAAVPRFTFKEIPGPLFLFLKESLGLRT